MKEKENFQKFITHYVWSSKDKANKPYWERLQNRYSEMVSRRRKLLKSIVKKELTSEGIINPMDKNDEIEIRIGDKEDKKQSMLKNFNVSYLVEMLNSSIKSVAREVVSTLVKPGCAGTLQILEKQIGEDFDNDEDEEAIEGDEMFVSPKQAALEGFTQPLKTKNTWKKQALDRKQEEDLHLPPAVKEQRKSGSFIANSQGRTNGS